MLKLFPYPYRYEQKEGSYQLPSGFSPSLLDILDGFEMAGLTYVVASEYDGVVLGKEGYALTIETTGITVYFGEPAGKFYALVSLKQLANNYQNQLPLGTIVDKPRLAYRGFMLDNGRYYFPVADIKKLIDLCALQKINVFHWHLTEDQGWRMQIERYPRLTEIGSQRTHTNFNRTPHGGYYTKRDMQEVVTYCKQRHITVVPELDIPGHAVAMLAAYKHLGCFEREVEVATHWGIKFDVLCVGKETTAQFMRDVLEEVVEIFDGPFVHLGGDEVPHERWKLCPHCQKKMVEEGLDNDDELQAHFVNELAKYLKTKGKTTITWNEHRPSGMCEKSTIWQLWGLGSGDNASQIAKDICGGRQYINSLSRYFYLDLPRQKVNLKDGYELDPILAGTKAEHLLGVEAPLWTEYVKNYKVAIQKTLPRLAAFAETMWTMQENKNYDRFMAAGETYQQYLQSCGYACKPFHKGNVGRLAGWLEYRWFQRRVLHWEGLGNLITNYKVRKKYGN